MKRPFTLRIDLRYLLYPCFVIFLLTAPLMRGLFFPADYFPYQVFAGAVLAVGGLDAALRRKAAFSGPVVLASLTLAIAYGAAFSAAASRVEAARGFLRYLTYFSAMWMSWHLSRESKGRKALLLTVFLSATLVAVVGILSAAGIFVFPGASSGPRISSTLQYPNALAAYMMFGSIIGLSLAALERHLLLRLVYVGAAYAQTLVFLSSYSRGGWGVYPVPLILFFLGMPKEYRTRAIGFLCSVTVSVLLVVRQFTAALESGSSRSTMEDVLFGLATAVIVLASFEAFLKITDQISSIQAKTLLRWAGGLFVAFTFGTYLVIFLSQYGVGLKGFLPASILKRLSSISVEDRSLVARWTMTKDALSIFLKRPFFGGGAGAWNAWYHQYQTRLYWTTETHNHYAQVLVESGIAGFLAYMSMWGFLAAGVWKHMRKPVRSRSAARVWGLFCACMAVAIHSAVDFELSLPAVAIHLWAVIGVVEAEIRPSDRPAGKPGRLLAVALIVIALIIAVPSYQMGRGASYGSIAAAHLAAHDYLTSLKLYEKAVELDPLNAAYHVDMGQAYSALTMIEEREDLREKAIKEYERARELEPYNVAYLLRQIDVLAAMGETAKAVELSRKLVDLIPLDVRSYEVLARNSLIHYLSCKQAGNTENGVETSLLSDAAAGLDSVLQIPTALENLKVRTAVKVSPTLWKYLGQAAYLRGDLEQAMTYLESAAKDRDNKAEALDWLLAVKILLGEENTQEASPLVREILGYVEDLPEADVDN